jgi:hypothetical protein
MSDTIRQKIFTSRMTREPGSGTMFELLFPAFTV